MGYFETVGTGTTLRPGCPLRGEIKWSLFQRISRAGSERVRGVKVIFPLPQDLAASIQEHGPGLVQTRTPSPVPRMIVPKFGN